MISSNILNSHHVLRHRLSNIHPLYKILKRNKYMGLKTHTVMLEMGSRRRHISSPCRHRWSRDVDTPRTNVVVVVCLRLEPMYSASRSSPVPNALVHTPPLSHSLPNLIDSLSISLPPLTHLPYLLPLFLFQPSL